MTWTTVPKGSFSQASTDVDTDFAGALDLPGSYQWHPRDHAMVRADQVANLPEAPPVEPEQ